MRRQYLVAVLLAFSSFATAATSPLRLRPVSRTKQIQSKRRDRRTQTRIIGGQDAPPGRYPWAVSLNGAVHSYPGHICGGTLIAPDVVLTAAHCTDVFSTTFTTAQIGRYDLSDSLDSFESFGIEEVILHPQTDFAEFDLALVKLDGESSVTPISLNWDMNVPAVAGTELTVIGWGETVPDSFYAILPDVLQEVTVNYVPNQECEAASNSQDSYQGLITPDMMCAMDYGEDACYGDSGGPLFIAGSNADQDVQVGVVSWGHECADPTFPGVYCRTSDGFDFIEATVCSISSNPPADFDCEGLTKTPTLSPVPTSSPTASPAPTGSVRATLLIQLDDYPEETGWRIEDSLGSVMFEVETGTYQTPFQEIEETLFLEVSKSYRFVITDSSSDGLCCDYGDGYYRIYIGSSTNGDLVAKGGNFDYMEEQVFESSASASGVVTEPAPTPLPKTPTLSPVPTTSPTASPAPTASASVTIVIQLDEYPEETGWHIEDSSGSVIFEVKTGTYQTPSQEIEEALFLEEGENYTFAISDSYYDGICCDYGDGYYHIYVGSSTNGDLVADGGDFGNLEEKMFVVTSGATDPLPTPPPPSDSTRNKPIPAPGHEIPHTTEAPLNTAPSSSGCRAVMTASILVPAFIVAVLSGWMKVV